MQTALSPTRERAHTDVHVTMTSRPRVAAFAAAVLLGAIATPCAAGTLIFGDNFNAPDTNSLDASDQTGRRSGLLAEDIVLRSSKVQHGIIGGQLNLLRSAAAGTSGRVRFHDADAPTVWWDFASGTAGTQITDDGGFRVDFDWTPTNNTSTEWIGYAVGIAGQATAEPPIRITNAETDFGILFRNNGGTQHFDNGAATTGGTFPATSVASRHVTLVFELDSFADGTVVSATASVNGVEVLTDKLFNLDNNAGRFYMELENIVPNTRIDNLTISSVPEPSTLGVVAAATAGFGLLRRRRRPC